MFKIVKEEGNVLIRVTFQLFATWAEGLQKAGFSVEYRPLVVVKKSKDVRYHRAKSRRPDLYAYVVAHKTQKFYWNSSEDVSKKWLPENTGSARSSYINNVPVVHISKRLRDANNQVVRKAENPIQELGYLIDTYCPLPGIVGDFCAGTLVSAMATLACGRTGVFGERDEQAATLGNNRAMAYYSWLQTSGTLYFVTFIHTTYPVMSHSAYHFPLSTYDNTWKWLCRGNFLIFFPTMVYSICYVGNLTRLKDQAALKVPDEMTELKPSQASRMIASLTDDWCSDDRIINLWMGKNNIPSLEVYASYNCHVRPLRCKRRSTCNATRKRWGCGLPGRSKKGNWLFATVELT
jgi:hypothetical protein